MNRAALHQLILEVFEGPEQFRIFLVHDDRSRELAHALPSVQLPATLFADEALRALEVRGLIDVAFFVRLAAERPRRRDAISRVAAMWHVPSHSLSAPPPEAPPSSHQSALDPIRLRFAGRTAEALDSYGVVSKTAGSLKVALRSSADPTRGAITFTSSLGHLQKLPSLGRGSKEVHLSRYAVRKGDLGLTWGEFDIHVSAGDDDGPWRVTIQSRHRRESWVFDIAGSTSEETEDTGL